MRDKRLTEVVALLVIGDGALTAIAEALVQH
jgi:hypothetical protein